VTNLLGLASDMHRLLNGIHQRFQKMNLSQRLVLSLVLVVVAIIVLSGLPANIAMWQALERQVWLRVQDAQSSTQGLYNAEITRLKKLSGLIAGRPTLYSLLQRGDLAAIDPYLEALKQESGNLDIVQVITPDLQAGDKLVGLPDPQVFLTGHEPYFADFYLLGDPGRLFIVGVSQILSPEANNPVVGWTLVE
jgi:hypothetical protein